MDDRKEFTYDKAALRKLLLQRRGAVTDKPLRAHAITKRVLPLVKGNVMVYVSIGSEVNTVELISDLMSRSDVRVYVPYTKNGIITPKAVKALGVADNMGNLPAECYENSYIPTKIDYCITPLLGFNAKGYRIGYGMGCYDRFFAEVSTYRIGLAYSDQLVEFTPDRTDVPLDCCVTEKNVIYF